MLKQQKSSFPHVKAEIVHIEGTIFPFDSNHSSYFNFSTGKVLCAFREIRR